MRKKKNEDQEWKKVYEFWKNVPTILEIEQETFDKIVDQEFRGTILDILREGIMDDNIQENGLSRRYAMSAPEMLPKIREKLGYEVKLSNVYFHLEKLEKANLIREVAKKLEGKHYVTYYGRTSKLILCCRLDDSDQCESKFLHSAYSLAEHLNLDIDTQMLNTTIKKIQSRNGELYQLEKEWIQNNHETLFQLDIDVLELFDFIKAYLRYSDPIIQELISHFYKEIKLEIYHTNRK
jgi:DNA-binding transcriptional ArsR family regulator